MLETPQRGAVFLAVPALAGLMLLPASATYHFILLAAPLALILKESMLTDSGKKVVVILYSLIGFIPYKLFFALSKKSGVFFGYPRLWLVTVLFATVVVLLHRQFRQSVSVIA